MNKDIDDILRDDVAQIEFNDDQHQLPDNQEFLTDENEDQLTEPEKLPTFQEFKANNYGRPTKYKEDMPERLFKYYFKPRIATIKEKSTSYGKPVIKTSKRAARFPTLEGFLVEQCIGESTFYEWIARYSDFAEVYKLCRSRVKDILIQNVLEGEWSYKVSILVAANYTNLRDVPIEEISSGEGVESVPERKKGYDISEIDKYCVDTVETTAVKVEDG